MLIDPQGQGRAWLRAKEAPHALAVSQLTDKNFRAVLEVRMTSLGPSIYTTIQLLWQVGNRGSISLPDASNSHASMTNHANEFVCHPCAQDCLSSGKPMLIENVEQELDPLLDPVLERRFLRKGRQVTVQLADKEVRAALQCGIYINIRQQRAGTQPRIFCSRQIALHQETVTALSPAPRQVPAEHDPADQFGGRRPL